MQITVYLTILDKYVFYNIEFSITYKLYIRQYILERLKKILYNSKVIL